MNKLRQVAVIALFVGSYQVGMAQSNSRPEFKNAEERAAWIKENMPEKEASAVNAQTSERENVQLTDDQKRERIAAYQELIRQNAGNADFNLVAYERRIQILTESLK